MVMEKITKYLSNASVSRIIIGGICLAMISITVLLFVEYRFFRQQTDQLIALKEDYQNHLTAVNKVLKDYNKTRERLEKLEGQKKKSDNALESFEQWPGFAKGVKVVSSDDDQITKDAFVVINRELDYLKQGGLGYLKKQRITVANSTAHDAWQDYHDQVVRHQRQQEAKKSFSRKRRRIARGRYRQQPIADDIFERSSTGSGHTDISFTWPIKRSDFWLSSFFGPRRRANGAPGFHTGIDLAAVRGTPVRAAAPGVVIDAHVAPGYGKMVVVAHSRKYKTRYAHLDKILVKPGQNVDATTVIGRVGSTGNVRSKWGRKGGSHLHFEVHAYGKKINPMGFFA